ncbi:MAG: 2,3-bisphosphoglycerate-independent phosphoglycerate mutase [Armatimonadetes bacterium]|nr:2,3-bisphosphoglycerate-independent phosphoglycerate mutase [Armatimonadota bacterium]
MKYVMVVIGGGADRPAAALYGKTPLQAAHLPTLDLLAREGLVGSADLVPEGVPLAPEPAALALLGYDPARYYTGPGPLDAAGRAVPLAPGDVAFRVDLVSSDGETLTDATAGGIAGAEAEALFREVAGHLTGLHWRFYPGRGRRHLFVWSGPSLDVACYAPGAAVGRPLPEVLPQGDGEATLRTLIYDSLEILDGHEVNDRRRDAGQPPANMIWLWGPGRAPSLPSFAATRGLGGAVISPAAYWRGLARLAGLRAPELPGATGRIETDYAGKAREAVAALQTDDFVLVHLGGPGAASVQGDAEKKVDALERLDARVLAPLLQGVKPLDDFRLLVVPDVAIPVEERVPVRDPVPFVLYASRGVARPVRAAFDESAVEESPVRYDEGYRLIELLLRG